ncbi:MAG: DUF1549 domain-containing protein, partial [Planctomycetales bacterium]
KKVDPLHAEKAAKGLALFKKHVRGILVERCLDCHGGDETESEFDLATREGLLRGGTTGAAVVSGKAEKSWLYKVLTGKEKPMMPYEDEKLSDVEIAHVAEWINMGAPYDEPLVEQKDKDKLWIAATVPESSRDYWAFQPLSDAKPPAVKNESWCNTPMDRFVLAKLEAAGISPNSSVSKAALVRRAYLNVTGLPPTPEDIERFVADESPDAYSSLLDRLMDDPAFGERWARHWLDVARFAESHGFEQDYDRKHAYHYRDFVIRAFNQDMPYDQFIRWQIAGDEYEPKNPLALTATGFLGAGVFPTQITANEVERTRYDALDDMASTLGTAMLGLTIGCARCHDHKYDPIPQADYYRIISTFAMTVRTEVDLDMDPEGYQIAKAKFDREHAPLAEAVKRFEAEELPARLAAWEKNRPETLQAKWTVLDFTEFKSQGGATLKKLDDGSLLASGKNPALDTYTLTARTELQGVTAIRLETLSHPSFAKGGPGRAGNGNIALSDFRATVAAVGKNAKPVPVKFAGAKATFEQKGLAVKNAIDGDKKSAWAVDPQFGKDHAAVFEIATNLGAPEGITLTFTLEFKNNKQHSIGRPRISVTTASRPVDLKGDGVPQNVAQALETPAAKRSKQ